MKELYKRLVNNLFGEHLEFRVRLFNVLGCNAILTLVLGSIANRFTGTGIELMLLYIACIVAAVLVLWYQVVSSNHKVACVMGACIFIGLLPPMFFINGGYHGGTLFHFMFAVVYTVAMFKGKWALFFTTLEIAIYTSLCVWAYNFPETIRYIDTEKSKMLHIVFCWIISTITLSLTVYVHFLFYDREQLKFDNARRRAEEYAKLNRNLVAELSHELRTPLAVMSGYALYAVERIKAKGITEETLADLSTISSEAQRLAKMADDTLSILKSSRLTDEKGNPKNVFVDIVAIVKKITSLQKAVTDRVGIELKVQTEDNLPQVYGDAGELSQIIWNILQNAIIHSSANTIMVETKTFENLVAIIVQDDGDGIKPDILGNIFNRGLGLPLSRDIAHRHGGKITIESKQGKGTRVVVSLPLSPNNQEA